MSVRQADFPIRTMPRVPKVSASRACRRRQCVAGCRVLTRIAPDYQMPLILTTTMEEAVGPTIEDIQTLAPDAFDKRFKRGGQLSCWDNSALTKAVAAIGRKKIILAGLTTDI